MRRVNAIQVGGALALAITAGAGGLAWIVALRPITVQTAEIERNVAVQIFGLGTVEARVSSKIGFKVSGVLTDLRADVGNRVLKGDVLARLDDREQSARVGRTKAAVEQAEANLQKAGANLEKAKANFTSADSINERRQKLLQTSVASIETAETAKAARDAALADVNVSQSDIAVARASVSDARAQREQEAATLDFHSLASPYDAMVITRYKELGSALGIGEPVFALIDPKSVWVLAYIDESKAGEIRVGNPAEIVLRSRPGERIPAKVARIEPESDRVNEERRVEVAFDLIPENFNLGEQAEVYITTVHLAHALLVPETAVEGLGRGSGTVWNVEDGSLQRHHVSLGHRLLDGRYEVTGGLPEDSAVVIKLTGGLRVGRSANLAGAPKP